MMNQTLGSRIAELRRKKNMTQEELAAELGVTPQAVSKWENDLSCPDITLLPPMNSWAIKISRKPPCCPKNSASPSRI